MSKCLRTGRYAASSLTPELLNEVFGGAIGRPVSLAMHGMAQERTADGAALHIQPTPSDAAHIVQSLTEGDLKRQPSLRCPTLISSRSPRPRSAGCWRPGAP
jgi:hypothetical protein